MRVYFLTPQTYRDYDLSDASERFFRWLVRSDGADVTDILRKFVGTGEEFGGLGGTIESADDLTPLADLIRTEIVAGLLPHL